MSRTATGAFHKKLLAFAVTSVLAGWVGSSSAGTHIAKDNTSGNGTHTADGTNGKGPFSGKRVSRGTGNVGEFGKAHGSAHEKNVKANIKTNTRMHHRRTGLNTAFSRSSDVVFKGWDRSDDDDAPTFGRSRSAATGANTGATITPSVTVPSSATVPSSGTVGANGLGGAGSSGKSSNTGTGSANSASPSWPPKDTFTINAREQVSTSAAPGDIRTVNTGTGDCKSTTGVCNIIVTGKNAALTIDKDITGDFTQESKKDARNNVMVVADDTGTGKTITINADHKVTTAKDDIALSADAAIKAGAGTTVTVEGQGQVGVQGRKPAAGNNIGIQLENGAKGFNKGGGIIALGKGAVGVSVDQAEFKNSGTIMADRRAIAVKAHGTADDALVFSDGQVIGKPIAIQTFGKQDTFINVQGGSVQGNIVGDDEGT
ncbi:MAG: hypothetical protein ACPG5T_05110, partial [Endozoicomonas sp.]